MQPRIVLIAFLIASLLFVQYGSSIEVIGSGSRAWARLYDRAFQAYSLERGGEATITYTRLINTAAGTAAQVARAALANNEVDFATADTIMTPQDLLSTPDMITFPTAATLIVPIFNLPGVASNKIILDMRTLALIFMGNITRWNAPELQALNPAIVLPATIIARVVRIDIIPLNTGIDQAFDTIPEWRDNVQTSSDSQFISYPDNGLPIYRCDGALPFSNAMSTVIGAIALSPLDDANRVGITYASMYNSAGRLVTPSVASTLFSVMEKGAQDMSDAIAQSQVTFNMNAAGLLAWPMTRYSYVVLRTNTYRATCRVRSETIRFWYWFYTSDVVVQIATALSFVIPPVEIRQQLGIESTLTSAMYCDDNLSYPVVRTGISLGSGSAIAADLFNVYPPIYNALSSTTGTITFQQTGSDRSLQRLVESEVDFASVMATVMAQDTLSAALDSNQVMLLPLFVRRVVPLYTLPTLLSTDNLKLSFEVLSLIWRGDITRWDDGRIAACNPDLQAAGKLPALNITLVFANAGDRDPEKLFMQALAYWGTDTSYPFNISYDSNGATLPYSSSVWYSRVVKRSIIVADDRKVDGVITATPGALGVAMYDVNLSSRRARLQLNTGEVVADSAAAVYQCMVDTFVAANLRLRLHQSSRAGCWPLAGVIYTVVRPDNEASVCTNTAAALKFLQYMHAQTSPTAEVASSLFAASTNVALTEEALAQLASIGAVSSTEVADQIGLSWMPPQIRSLVQLKLQTITCEGETILVTLPVPHPLSSEVESAALAISIIGYVLAAVMLCFLYFFHLRTAIKASSPLFLLATLSGLLLLLVSGALMAKPSPSDSSCRSAWWTANLGFMLTFAPLFAKCWRIYKIFMRKEMTVIRITDSNLIVRLIVALVAQVIFLAAIEGTDPFLAVSSVQSALPRDQIIYYCSSQSPALPSTLAACYGLMLLFGALMSFSTRSVAEHFNESRSIAFAIYNVLFTLAIVVPIALLQKSDGRTIWMLVIFATYWLTLCTFLISFLPKVHAIYQDASGLIAARVSDSRTSNSDGGGSKGVGRTLKDFVSQPIRLMDRSTLRAYLSLLEREINAARATLGTLEANEGVLAAGHGGGGSGNHHSSSYVATTPKAAPMASPMNMGSTSPSNRHGLVGVQTSTGTGIMIGMAPTPRVNTGASTTSLPPQSSPSSQSLAAASTSSVSSLITSAASIRFVPSSASASSNGMSYRSTAGSLSTPPVMPVAAASAVQASSSSFPSFNASAVTGNSSHASSPPQAARMFSSLSDAPRDRSAPREPSSRAIASYVAPGVVTAAAGAATSNNGTHNTHNVSPPMTRSSSPHHSRSGTPANQIEGGISSSHSSPRGIGDKVVLTVDPCPPPPSLASHPTSPDSNDSSSEASPAVGAALRPALSIHTSSANERTSPSAEPRRMVTSPSPLSHQPIIVTLPTSDSNASANGLPHV